MAMATPYESIGGQEQVKALTERFYDLMDATPEFARLREVHGASLDNARLKTFLFLCGWLGGPQTYTETYGHPRLRARHMHVPIGIKERDQWLACMDRAMGDTGVDETLRAQLRVSFFKTADFMRNV